MAQDDGFDEDAGDDPPSKYNSALYFGAGDGTGAFPNLTFYDTSVLRGPSALTLAQALQLSPAMPSFAQPDYFAGGLGEGADGADFTAPGTSSAGASVAPTSAILGLYNTQDYSAYNTGQNDSWVPLGASLARGGITDPNAQGLFGGNSNTTRISNPEISYPGSYPAKYVDPYLDIADRAAGIAQPDPPVAHPMTQEQLVDLLDNISTQAGLAAGMSVLAPPPADLTLVPLGVMSGLAGAASNFIRPKLNNALDPLIDMATSGQSYPFSKLIANSLLKDISDNYMVPKLNKFWQNQTNNQEGRDKKE